MNVSHHADGEMKPLPEGTTAEVDSIDKKEKQKLLDSYSSIEEKKKELKTKIFLRNPVQISIGKPIGIKKRERKKSKITWDKVSTQEAANWIKENYTGYHFTSEMLIRFLMEEHITFPDYFSSEELKKYPQANEADDLKAFVFSAVSKDNPFLKLEQLFYNAETENLQLKATEEDFKLIKDRSPKDRSGIYFSIIE